MSIQKIDCRKCGGIYNVKFMLFYKKEYICAECMHKIKESEKKHFQKKWKLMKKESISCE